MNLPPLNARFSNEDILRVLNDLYKIKEPETLKSPAYEFSKEDLIRRQWVKNTFVPPGENSDMSPASAELCEKILLAVLQNPSCNVYAVQNNIELARTYINILRT